MEPFDRNEIQVLGLEFTGRHGVYEQERRDGCRFRADLTARVGRLGGFTTDRLEETLDYRALAKAVVEVGEGPSVTLVEHLAHKIAERCLAFSEVRAIDLTLRKRAEGVPGDPEWVAVRVVRAR